MQLQYAGFVLQKTYQSLKSSLGICDAHCREVTSATVASALFVSTVPEYAEGPSTTTMAEPDEGTGDSAACQRTYKVVFALEGTYWGCGSDDDFPGVFSESTDDNDEDISDDDNIFSHRRRSLLRRRNLRQTAPRSAQPLDARRLGEGDAAAPAACGKCSQEPGGGDFGSPAASQQALGPTPDQLRLEMEPSLTVLPGICGISSIKG